ncbi:MAG TPA: DedA family protein [Candidatus Woesebacteria bacterium]|nr:DedA family protein [Candidatus Woesebacteria bacterium]
MEIVKYIIDLFLHVDKNLVAIISQYGTLTYGLLFFVIFMETGLVVTPFLPGDSLLFAAGALAAMGSMKIGLLFLLMVVAAILGDTVNYWIGHKIGRGVFEKGSRFFKKEYLEEAEAFYAKHGGAAIFLGRFVPIVRTFVPFVAGVSEMSYKHFITYNIVGGLSWVTLFLMGGFLFGNIPFVKENFHYVVVLIVLISVVPILWGVIKKRKK